MAGFSFSPMPIQMGDIVKESVMKQVADKTKPSGLAFDPNLENYRGRDTSALRRSLEQNIARRGARSRAQAAASLAKAGIRGADTSRAISDIAGQESEAQMALDAQLAAQDYADRIAERNFQYGLAMDKYNKENIDWAKELEKAFGPWQKEKQEQSDFMGSLLGGAAKLGGGMMGGM